MKATKWVGRLCSLARGNSSIPSQYVWQLYQAVGVAQFQYTSGVWYTTSHLSPGGKKKQGLIRVTAKLTSIQRAAATAVTRAMKTTAADVLDMHANLIPVELTMDKAKFNSAVQLCTLLETHPLHKIMQEAAGAIANSKLPTHPSPIHRLLQAAKVTPDTVETISPPTRQPHRPFGFQTHIAETREETLKDGAVLLDNEGGADMLLGTEVVLEVQLF